MRINIGNNNKIKNTNIGNNNRIESSKKGILIEIGIGIFVTVVGGIILHFIIK